MADPVKILTGFPTPPVTPPMPIIPSVASFFDAYLKKDELPSTATIIKKLIINVPTTTFIFR